MAQYYDASEIAKKLENQFNICKWVKADDGKSFILELPLVLYFNYQRLRLYIYPVDDGYYISDDGETFLEYSYDTKYYFDMFTEKDKNYHYNIELKDDHICKRFEYDYSLHAAIDEFIRFFVYLADFMQRYDCGEFDEQN